MCRNEYNKTEDIDERDILLRKMVTSEVEVERLVKKIEEITPQQEEMSRLLEENQKLKEFIQTMGDQMNKLAQKVEEVEECQVVNLRNRQIDPVERPERTRKTSNEASPDSQHPYSQPLDSQLPDS
jgi:predicted nuclease with TOPRIM domain